MQIDPQSCCFCKHSSYDNTDRAQIRLMGKPIIPVECYKWKGNKYKANFNDSGATILSNIINQCNVFEPCKK